MAFNQDQFTHIIDSVLWYLDPEIPYSRRAVKLLLMTAAHESRFGTYLKQIGGPARGVFQMEPTTEQDIWSNFLRYKRPLYTKITRVVPETSDFDQMSTNLVYQIAMARVHYWRVPEPLPETTEGCAEYWKKYYNTHKGKGSADSAIMAYNFYVQEDDV